MVEIDWTFLLSLILIIFVGIPVVILTFFVVRRLVELHRIQGKFEGDLYVSEGGEIFSEFSVPITELTKKNYILLKVHKIETTTLKEENEYGNVPAQTYKTRER